MRRIACSATEAALPDSSLGIRATMTPFRVAASMSTVSSPTRNCWISPNVPCRMRVSSTRLTSGTTTSASAMWAPSFSGGKARISSSGRSAASLVRASGKASAQNRIFMDIFLWLSRVIRPSVRVDTGGYFRYPGRAHGDGGERSQRPLMQTPEAWQ